MKLAEMKNHYDEDNKLEYIECNDAVTGEHIFNAVWTEGEEHSLQNKMEHHRWTIQMLKRAGYEVK